MHKPLIQCSYILTVTFQEIRDDLESLLERNHDKSSYVEEWASKHAFPHTSLEPLSPRDTFSPEETKSSLTSNKSRRMLPATPNSHPTRSPDVLTFSPDSEQGSSLTPPAMNESDDDDSSYVTHTQHLVDVMEERIKQVSKYNYAAMKYCLLLFITI